MNSHSLSRRRLLLFMATTSLVSPRHGASGPVPPPSTPYPISGFWLFARRSPAPWRTTLTRIRRLGADTVIQFGPRLHVRTPEEIDHDPVFGRWRLGGQGLVAASMADLAARFPGASLRHVFTYSPSESFGPVLLSRPGLDVRLESGPRVVWRLLIPVGEPPADAGADSLGKWDLVLVAAAGFDSVASLLKQAEPLGMHVFVGLPAPPPHPRYPWDPWSEAVPSLLALTGRVLADYAQRYGDSPSFAGVYQSQETPVSRKCLPAVLALYRRQHKLVRDLLPGKRILVSPYWDARRGRPTGSTVEEVKAGIKLLAHQTVDILAPQDGRGTGKVGLFRPCDKTAPVDPRLVPTVGDTTYGNAYFASTRELYRAARAAVTELAADENLHVRLWANLEAFEPGAGIPCGSFHSTQRTTKERLDQAVMFAGPYPEKLVSYMWDSYYLCRAGRTRSLAEEIEQDWRRPLLVDVRRCRAGKRDGFVLRGYNLSQAWRVRLRLHTAAGTMRELTRVIDSSRVHLPLGVTERRLQTVWVPVSPERLASAVSIDFTVLGPAGACAHPFVVCLTPEPGTAASDHHG